MSKKQKFTYTIKDKFIKVPAAVLRCGLSSGSLTIYLYLLDSSDTWTPSIRQIMKGLNMANQTVVNGLNDLEERGMVTIERGDEKTKSRYKLERWWEKEPVRKSGTKGVLKISTGCTESQYTPVLKSGTGGVLKISTFPDERSQIRDQDEYSKTALYTKNKDNKGSLPSGQKKLSSEDLMREQIQLEEKKIQMDRLAEEIRGTRKR
jgi:predicted transcriptional regulator